MPNATQSEIMRTDRLRFSENGLSSFMNANVKYDEEELYKIDRFAYEDETYSWQKKIIHQFQNAETPQDKLNIQKRYVSLRTGAGRKVIKNDMLMLK